MSGNLPSGKDLYANPFKAKGGEILSQAAIGPGLTSWRKENGGGTSPEFANPKDFFNGKWESQLTGDKDKDTRNAFARFGPASMIFGPAIWNESMKKGDKLDEQFAMEQEQQNSMANFNRYQDPYQRRQMQPMGQPLSGGNYNDLVMQLFQNSQMGNNQMSGLL